jgi:hypothetical protein
MMLLSEQRIVRFLAFVGLKACFKKKFHAFSGKQNLLFSTFSVYSNGLRLFATQEPASADIISCVYGLRAISILWIIHGHRVQTYENFPIINKAQFLGVMTCNDVEFFLRFEWFMN